MFTTNMKLHFMAYEIERDGEKNNNHILYISNDSFNVFFATTTVKLELKMKTQISALRAAPAMHAAAPLML